jgi:hypothetical protein
MSLFVVNSCKSTGIYDQRWALAPFFKNRSSLFALFFTMVHYRSFCDFQGLLFATSLLKNLRFALRYFAPKKFAVRSLGSLKRKLKVV